YKADRILTALLQGKKRRKLLIYKGKGCGRRDSNSHALRHVVLSHVRLPFRHFRGDDQLYFVSGIWSNDTADFDGAGLTGYAVRHAYRAGKTGTTTAQRFRITKATKGVKTTVAAPGRFSCLSRRFVSFAIHTSFAPLR